MLLPVMCLLIDASMERPFYFTVCTFTRPPLNVGVKTSISAAEQTAFIQMFLSMQVCFLFRAALLIDNWSQSSCRVCSFSINAVFSAQFYVYL